MKKINPWAIVVTIVAVVALGVGGYVYFLQTTGPVVVTHRFTPEELRAITSGPPPKQSETKTTTPKSANPKG